MNRLDKLRLNMQQDNVTAQIIFNQYNITYITGFNGHAATLLITPEYNYLITDYRYLEQAQAQAKGFTVICRDRVNQSLASLLSELVNKEHIDRLGFESAHISVEQWQLIADHMQVKHLIPTRRIVESLRYIKDETEIASIKQAAGIADQALSNIFPLIKAGVTERELALELEYHMSKLGSEAPAFDTILLFGERSALPHGIPGNRALTNGDLILIDFGATINGYRSDMTRTYVFGAPSEQQLDIYQIVASAQQAAIDGLKAGITGTELNKLSEEILNASEFGQYQGEGLGHGVGLELHEFPFVGKQCDQVISPGCVITIEPGIYIPGWGGIRIEDDIALTANGIEILNKAPKSFLQFV